MGTLQLHQASCHHHFTAPSLCSLFPALQVVALCERLAGQDAKVTTVPVGVLDIARRILRLFQWTSDVADRLAFSQVRIAGSCYVRPLRKGKR